ncbi:MULTISPECIES: response regulator [unclassified Luteibacter]|uniref:response regulator n=1 Tax=unclassified Luteibacter TaxID=2620188 RepID=UPI00068B485F|nr:MULTISPECIES: response regulator [unclassified Luteibacter]MDR6642337.1 PAS domain S-box-containing protein [Luteibacter sp. 1214]
MAVPSTDSSWFLPHDRELGRLIRDLDWSATALGPIHGWPPTLRHALAAMLRADAPMAIFQGPEGVFLYNDAYRAIAGVRHPEVLGRPIVQAWPELAEFNRNVLDVVLAGGTLAYRDQHVVLDRSGESEDAWLHLDFSPLVDTSGVAGGVLVVIKETTRRVEVEERLRIAQQAGGVGSFEWFPETGRLEVSEEYRRIWGLPAEGIVTDAMLGELLHPDDRHEAAPQRLDRANPLDYTEYRRIDPLTGEVRWIARRGEVIARPGQARRRFIGIVMDITARKAAETELAAFAATLQERVTQRTAELLRTQDALRQSQKMEAIGNLTGGVAHDFNNLLQVISGNLQLLAEDVGGNERAERRVRHALAGVARGSKLASQLLSFGRRQPLAPKVVNIGRFIRNMDDLLRRTLGEAIEVETIVAGGLWNTLIDPGNVENALLNLAINARDAMDGQGRLTIEAGNAYLDAQYVSSLDDGDVTAGQYVLLAVTDTGHGIDATIVDKVFEPFFTTKPEGRGTGLGLSMVYGFVKQSGGHIKVYSEPGEGTTVKLYLPRTTQSEDIIVDIDAGPVTGGHETILVAEDDEAVRDTVVALLANLGYRVLKARDAQSALSIVDSGIPIDLLFTDVVMPGPLKSPELARKARERLPGLAVLFTSGYTENSIVHGGRLDEGVELLSKPYTRETLGRKLRQILAAQAQRHAGDPATPSVAAPTPAATKALRILVVEDDWLVRTTVVEMLQLRGHDVREAGDGTRATALLDQEAADLVITDVGLPGISGIELAATLRQRFPDLAVIFATGHAGTAGLPDDERSAVLAKPYGSQALTKAVSRLFPSG